MKPVRSVYEIISPVEREYAYPLIEIAKYIRRHAGAKPSKHHITRLYDPLVELVQTGHTATAVAKIMNLFSRHYGFYNKEEKDRVLTSVTDLVMYVSKEAEVSPSTVHQLLRNMRDFLYALVTGIVPLPEKGEGGETHA